MFGDYDELGDEWDNLSIDTVSIQSKGQPLEIVYKVDPSFLSEVSLYDMNRLEKLYNTVESLYNELVGTSEIDKLSLRWRFSYYRV